MAFNHSWQAALHPGETDDFFRIDHPIAFVTHADEFNPVNAWWMSELSRLIYKRNPTEASAATSSRNDYLRAVGMMERRFFNHPNVQAALVEGIGTGGSEFSALVFRGTAGRLSNWRFNLDMATCPWPIGGRVHRGFGHLIMQIWGSIAAAITDIDHPLYFTGHSLGGALATLAASLHKPHAVYTFGAPRIGNRAFAQALSDVKVYNVVNAHDPVTHLPPAGPGFRFSHAGRMIKNGKRAPSHRSFGQAPAFLADHAPLNYTAQLPIAFKN